MAVSPSVTQAVGRPDLGATLVEFDVQANQAGFVGHRIFPVMEVAEQSIKGIVASASFDGATDTELFATFVRDALLAALKPGQVLVMDNLPAHKSPQIDQLVESIGARVLRLPPYSPDFNPIEMAISKIKTMLRKLAKRSVNGLFSGIGEALESIRSVDALNYITHCGSAMKRCKLL